MAAKKSLYQLLEVAPDAEPGVLKSAYEARAAKLADAVGAEDLSNRAMVREAFDVLNDPARRKQYDERLRAERVRALASGMEEERPRPATARARPEISDPPAPTDYGRVMYGLAALVVAAAVGGWVYSNHASKVAAQRLEAQKLAAETRKQEADEQARQQSLQLAKDHFDARQQGIEDRQRQNEIERARRQYAYEQQVQSQHAVTEERRRQDQVRAADSQRQREEQESLRRSQMQLERDRRYLQELERNRGQKF